MPTWQACKNVWAGESSLHCSVPLLIVASGAPTQLLWRRLKSDLNSYHAPFSLLFGEVNSYERCSLKERSSLAFAGGDMRRRGSCVEAREWREGERDVVI